MKEGEKRPRDYSKDKSYVGIKRARSHTTNVFSGYAYDPWNSQCGGFGCKSMDQGKLSQGFRICARWPR